MGMIYGLIACGFSLVFRMTRVLNFAAGDIVMLGGMIGYSVYVLLGLPFVVALLVSCLAVGLLMAFVERVALSPVYRRGLLPAVVATIGLSFAIQNGSQLVWGRGGFSFPTVFGNEAVEIAGVRFVPELVAIFLIGMAVVAAITIFLGRSRLGIATRATAADREAALLMGIDVRRMNSLSFFIAGAISAIAGILVAPVTFLTATMGLPLGVKGFIAAICGGLGNMPGAIIGGLILGLTETSIGTYIDASYREGISFVVMIAILLVRPYGLFGEEGTEEER
jgi:branched-chain amino acid transport system permease protein